MYTLRGERGCRNGRYREGKPRRGPVHQLLPPIQTRHIYQEVIVRYHAQLAKMPQNAAFDNQVVTNDRVFEHGGLVRAIPDRHVTELMLELLALKPTDKLLEIGTGSATQTAIWQQYCAEVHTIELIPVPCADYLGDATYFHSGDGMRGLPSDAPFDAIVVTCGTEVIAEAWKEQLADGGRLVLPYGPAECQKLSLFMKKNGVFAACRVAGYVRFQQMREA